MWLFFFFFFGRFIFSITFLSDVKRHTQLCAAPRACDLSEENVSSTVRVRREISGSTLLTSSLMLTSSATMTCTLRHRGKQLKIYTRSTVCSARRTITLPWNVCPIMYSNFVVVIIVLLPVATARRSVGSSSNGFETDHTLPRDYCVRVNNLLLRF